MLEIVLIYNWFHLRWESIVLIKVLTQSSTLKIIYNRLAIFLKHYLSKNEFLKSYPGIYLSDKFPMSYSRVNLPDKFPRRHRTLYLSDKFVICYPRLNLADKFQLCIYEYICSYENPRLHSSDRLLIGYPRLFLSDK